MHIEVRTDNHIEGSAELRQQVQELLEEKLRRFQNRITRIEVHFTDESSAAKSGDDDKRCVIEARLRGLDPLSATDRASTVPQALSGATRKLLSLLDRTLGRLEDR